MGGKTGTGDNRIEAIGAGGRILRLQVHQPHRHLWPTSANSDFGTLTAFVPGSSAQGFTFTSALPVQVLGHGTDPHAVPATGGPLYLVCR